MEDCVLKVSKLIWWGEQKDRARLVPPIIGLVGCPRAESLVKLSPVCHTTHFSSRTGEIEAMSAREDSSHCLLLTEQSSLRLFNYTQSRQPIMQMGAHISASIIVSARRPSISAWEYAFSVRQFNCKANCISSAEQCVPRP